MALIGGFNDTDYDGMYGDSQEESEEVVDDTSKQTKE